MKITDFEEIREYLPLLIPVIIASLTLTICSVVHILRHNNYKHGNRALWLVIALCINMIGPALYFALGKEEE